MIRRKCRETTYSILRVAVRAAFRNEQKKVLMAADCCLVARLRYHGLFQEDSA